MKAIKITEGSLSTLDKTFEFDKAIEVTDKEVKYLKDTFDGIFKFEGTSTKPLEIVKEPIKEDAKEEVKKVQPKGDIKK